MPCFGPDGPQLLSNKELYEIEKKQFIEYVNNTAYLLEDVLLCLNKQIDDIVIKAKTINYINKELSDDITERLCTIIKDETLHESLSKSKYSLQLGLWWKDHQKLDLKNKNK